jgi:LacI family transcriptional regulator
MDGLILMLSIGGEKVVDEIDQLADRSKPLVLLSGVVPGIDLVGTSYRDGAAALMNYLLSLGHQRIGLIYGVAHFQMGIDRMNAYREGLQNAGINGSDTLIEHCGTTIEDGYRAALRLIDRKPRPTAIMVINDLLAIGTLRAAAERGLRVPDDISIASFDDINFAAYTNPPLTTVRMDADALGRKAASLIFNRLQNPRLPVQEVWVEGELVVRASTGRPPAK